ncbi:DUF7557 family protein [Methanosarcina sp. UBA5]|uniref:DUF7557 family protein n=1 Tax=Methanosarcina sp. UBA5 TaxID=1915593 RepID=UPI0025D01E97|nr:hypothetical protein [Methanosarcina sp. UBA5]
MVATTTISLDPETKEKLDEFKINPEESYNSVVERLIYMATDHEPLSEEKIKGIEESLREYAEGKFYTAEEVWGDLEKDE